jgi:aryl-alcohol dehydrogenase-like predicted oxidoreductase
MVDKIGVSIYNPHELEALTSRFRFDIVQAPFSVMDRRLATSGWLGRLHAAGTEVHVRSLFLQGLLLMHEAARPRYFDRWRPLFSEWQGWLDANALTALRACVGFALSHAEVDRAIVGVDSLEQLLALVAGASAPPVTVPNHLSSEDSALVNPSQWNLS